MHSGPTSEHIENWPQMHSGLAHEYIQGPAANKFKWKLKQQAELWAEKQCLGVPAILSAKSLNKLDLIVFRCPDHHTNLHSQKMAFISLTTFHEFWGKRPNATTKVTLNEPAII